MLKRMFDIVLALCLLLPAAVLILIAGVLIRRDSPGPAIFRQVRVGRAQKRFILYKLRTMRSGTGDRASHETSETNVTRIGAVLRRTKVDELPQIWSVIRGDMSFVGPRPCLPSQAELIHERQSRGVFDVLPGITGPAQLAGVDMSQPKRLAEIDATYAKNASLRTDVALIIATALGRGSGDAVGK